MRTALTATENSGARGAPEAAANPFGKVFTPHELAGLWKLSENSIRRMFQDEPGVFVMANGRRTKRNYETLRIPESIALRVWRERCR
jgi:hypothetical protein